jgi:hypothetical protein
VDIADAEKLVIVALLASGNAAEQLNRDQAYVILAAVFVAAGLAYWLSLRLHPYARCGACKGAGRARGMIFTHSFGMCRRCEGTGRKLRLGVRLFRSSNST